MLQPEQMCNNLIQNRNYFQHGFSSIRVYFLICALVNMQVTVFYSEFMRAHTEVPQ